MKIILPILFSVFCIGIGFIILVYPDQIRTELEKYFTGKWFEVTSPNAVWSWRFGGAMSLVIGVFVLFMTLKHIFSQ